jgi:hypothetical protein
MGAFSMPTVRLITGSHSSPPWGKARGIKEVQVFEETMQPTVGENTGIPATETQTQTQTPTQTPQTPTEKMLAQSEVNRIVAREKAQARDAITRELGAKPEDVKAFMQAVKSNPAEVARLLGTPPQQVRQTQPTHDPRVNQLQETVYAMQLESELTRLQKEYPRMADAANIEKVLTFASENGVDPESAYLRLFVKADIEDAKKSVVESMRKSAGAWMESGETAPDKNDEVELTADQRRVAREFVKRGVFKSLREYAESLK